MIQHPQHNLPVQGLPRDGHLRRPRHRRPEGEGAGGPGGCFWLRWGWFCISENPWKSMDNPWKIHGKPTKIRFLNEKMRNGVPPWFRKPPNLLKWFDPSTPEKSQREGFVPSTFTRVLEVDDWPANQTVGLAGHPMARHATCSWTAKMCKRVEKKQCFHLFSLKSKSLKISQIKNPVQGQFAQGFENDWDIVHCLEHVFAFLSFRPHFDFHAPNRWFPPIHECLET